MKTSIIQQHLLAVLVMLLLPVMAAATPASLSIEDFDIKAGETKTMLVDLTNPDTEVTLVQFDMELPTGLTIAEEEGEALVDIAGRTTWKKHALNTNTSGNLTRMLLASNTNALIAGTSGAIISITLTATSVFNGGDIKLKNQLIVTPAAEETEPEEYTYTIEGTVTLKANDYSRKYGEENPDFGYTVTKGTIVDGTPSITCEATAESPVGTYDIVIAKGTVSNKSVELVKGTLTITKADASTTTAPTAVEGLIYSGAAQTLVAAGSENGGEMQYSLDGVTYAATLPTGTNVGSYTVYYKVVGDANHNDTEAATVTGIEIGKATLTATADDKVRAYGAENPELTISYSGWKGSDNAAALSAVPVAATEATAASSVGNYDITVSGGNAANYEFNYGKGTLTITKAAASVATVPTAVEGLVYSGAAQALVAAGTANGGEMQYSLDGEAYTATLPTGTNAGSYTVYYKVVGDANHNDTEPATVAASIGKAASSVGNAPTAVEGLVYSGSAQALIAAGTVNGGEMQYSLDGETYTATLPAGTQAGSYTVYYKVAGDANHNDTEVATVTASIGKAASSVGTAPAAVEGLIYSGSAQSLVAAGTANGGGMQYSLDGVTYAATLPTGTQAGSYTVYYKVVGDANHNDTEAATVTGIEIGKATLTATADDKVRAYGAENPELTISYSGWKGSDDETVLTETPTATTEANAESEMGEYAITVSGGEAVNYVFTYVNGTLTIRNLDPVIETEPVAEADLVYTGEPQALITAAIVTNGTMVYSLDGNNYSVEVPTATDAGSYTVYCKLIPEDSDDGEVVNMIEVAISKATMNVTATDYVGTYDGDSHGITVNAPTGATVVYGTVPGAYVFDMNYTYLYPGIYTIYYKVTMPNYEPVEGQARVVIKQPTGVSIIENSKSGIVDSDYYDLNGCKHDGEHTKSGIYIVGGKKILVTGKRP